MPATPRVLAALPADRRHDLEQALRVLADTGCSVTILPDGDADTPATGLGYRVTINGRGFSGVTRLRVDATAAEWAGTLAILRHCPSA